MKTRQKNNRPYFDLNRGEEYVAVSPAALRRIGSPNFVRFWWNLKDPAVIIEPIDMNDPNAIEVEAEIYEQNKPLIFYSCDIFIENLWNHKWDIDDCYRVPIMTYGLKNNAIMFDMKDAVVNNAFEYEIEYC